MNIRVNELSESREMKKKRELLTGYDGERCGERGRRGEGRIGEFRAADSETAQLRGDEAEIR